MCTSSNLVKDFVLATIELLGNKNHAGLLATVMLIIEMIKMDKLVMHQFYKLVLIVMKLLKDKVLASFVCVA